MKLKTIRLAGFKSFVDPTSLVLPSRRVAIVGPNGCGKSNLLDAVRWVMGESSAKQLRGESMADVIFSGSRSRKPVGQAAIELVFDNTDGRLGGQYAGYREISVRREVSRDGQSVYRLNGARCRRRDVTDVFLGTGLGPRSYSIIEQGVISKVVEANPEQLRAFLEEAAGISRYKERRKETETRIRHTRDNLERLLDLCEEVDKQVERLRRQARAAERYRQLRRESRELKARALGLQLRDELARQELLQGECESLATELSRQNDRRQSLDADLESRRNRLSERNRELNVVQERFAELRTQVARLEQQLQHGRTRLAADAEERRRSLGQLETLRSEHAQDRQRCADLEVEIGRLRPAHAGRLKEERELAALLRDQDRSLRSLREQVREQGGAVAAGQRSAEVERARIDLLEGQLQDLAAQDRQLDQETAELQEQLAQADLAALRDAAVSCATRMAEARTILATVDQELEGCRLAERQVAEALQPAGESLQVRAGRLSSLRTLQEAALGRDDRSERPLLADLGLVNAPSVGESLRVAEGWEQAAEMVLQPWLDAVVTSDLEGAGRASADLKQGSAAFVSTTGSDERPKPAAGLAGQVEGLPGIQSLLQGVGLASDAAEALSRRDQLVPGESLVSRDGLWVGCGWLRCLGRETGEEGVLQRGRQILALEEEIERLGREHAELKARQSELGERRKELEKRRSAAAERHNTLQREQAGAQARLQSAESRMEQMQAQLDGQRRSREQLAGRRREGRDQLRTAREGLELALETLQRARGELETAELREREADSGTAGLRQRLGEVRAQVQRLTVDLERRGSTLESLRRTLIRQEEQLAQLEGRAARLENGLNDLQAELPTQEKLLASLLEERSLAEQALQESRRQAEGLDAGLRQLERERHLLERAIQGLRDRLEQRRLALGETQTLGRGLESQLDELGADPARILAELDDDLHAGSVAEALQSVEDRIRRLGAVNLAAAEEFQTAQERKEYLKTQREDLEQALATLEGAMGRMDRETRSRFKETFEAVTAKLSELFPRLFGGGRAFLQLTDQDLLETGVTIMAQPPGKRISSIHLLSGGEKALAAVALVFSIFELNPAPLCILDEVDAPLDDANVGRFCELVKAMSERVQFLFITHNKVTMGAATHLVGVTMHEPGCSRLVAVDVEQAMALAEAS